MVLPTIILLHCCLTTLTTDCQQLFQPWNRSGSTISHPVLMSTPNPGLVPMLDVMSDVMSANLVVSSTSAMSISPILTHNSDMFFQPSNSFATGLAYSVHETLPRTKRSLSDRHLQLQCPSSADPPFLQHLLSTDPPTLRFCCSPLEPFQAFNVHSSSTGKPPNGNVPYCTVADPRGAAPVLVPALLAFSSPADTNLFLLSRSLFATLTLLSPCDLPASPSMRFQSRPAPDTPNSSTIRNLFRCEGLHVFHLFQHMYNPAVLIVFALIF